MSPQINSHAWTEGFKTGYAGLTDLQVSQADRFSLDAGRADGEALREKHLAEYEWTLSEGVRRLSPGKGEGS